jgi:hypothetical protein
MKSKDLTHLTARAMTRVTQQQLSVSSSTAVIRTRIPIPRAGEYGSEKRAAVV